MRPLWTRCGALWDRRTEIVRELDLRNDPTAASDFLDVILLWLDSPATTVRPLTALADLESLLGPQPVLDLERRSRGVSGVRSPAVRKPRTAWEHVAVGRSLFRQGKVDEARAEAEAALKRQPGHAWASFLLGRCAFVAGRYDEAAAAFSVCMGADPTSAVHPYNRSLALSALGQTERAAADLELALALDPALAPARRRR